MEVIPRLHIVVLGAIERADPRESIGASAVGAEILREFVNTTRLAIVTKGTAAIAWGTQVIEDAVEGYLDIVIAGIKKTSADRVGAGCSLIKGVCESVQADAD